MQSATEKSNDSNESPSESSGNANANANGGSDPHINPGFLRISVEERAATRIQKAFRAYRVRSVKFWHLRGSIPENIRHWIFLIISNNVKTPKVVF